MEAAMKKQDKTMNSEFKLGTIIVKTPYKPNYPGNIYIVVDHVQYKRGRMQTSGTGPLNTYMRIYSVETGEISHHSVLWLSLYYREVT